MGRTAWSCRLVAEQCLSISTSWLNHNRLFTGFNEYSSVWNVGGKEKYNVKIEVCTNNTNLQEGSYMRLRYSIGMSEDIRDMDYKIRLVTAHCKFGGIRYWFLCGHCKKRVGVLYLPVVRGAKWFACRKCYNITYRSSKEH